MQTLTTSELLAHFDHLNYQAGTLFIENISLSYLAKQYGTPLYVYSKKSILHAFENFYKAFEGTSHLICYAVKANSNLSILNLFNKLGSGFDIVSAGELIRVLKAGGDPKKVVFSGVSKSEEEINLAIKNEVLCINIESENELDRIANIAQQIGKKASISIRINPDVDPKTHHYISTGLKENKFGISTTLALELYRKANKMSWIDIKGMAFHIGSQITKVNPFVDATKKSA